MQKELNYNYVYFNSNCGKKWELDPDEYNAVCLRDLTKLNNVTVVQCILGHLPLFLRILCAIHNSQRINNHLNLPFKRIWYPFYFKKNKKRDKPYCFIVSGTNLSMDYLKYLRHKYPDSKFVKIHRDLMKITHENPEYSEENMNKLFDLRLTYDEGEAEKYGILSFDEIESKVEIPVDKDYPLCDVFFAGKAKDRFQKIIKAYDIFETAGLKCDFFITGVPKDKQIIRAGIVYSDVFMPYKEMLYKSVNARCMLDINQEGAIGYTSRFLEAIIYNKKLIANNPSMLCSKYYNPKFIQFVEKMEDINPSFVTDECLVDYHYEGDFSPINLILQIDNELSKANGKG